MKNYTTDQLVLIQEAIDLMLSEGDLIFTQFSDLIEVKKDVEKELRYRRDE